MNKVINININGEIFHVDEPAYDKLKNYLDRLKNHFRNTEGKEEILADIESRIAEMLRERKGKKDVVLIEDVNATIEAMGQPEDMEGAENPETGDTFSQGSAPYGQYSHYHRGKRLFRNPDDKWIGGVCGGLGAYFGLDPLWLRLAFLIAFLTFGSGLLIYIILWILIPEALTPSEKLEMFGEKININNIEKRVTDEINNLKKKAGGISDTVSEYGRHIHRDSKSSVQRFFTVIGEIFIILVKIVVVFFIFIGLIVLLSLAVGIIGAAVGLNGSFLKLPSMFFTSPLPMWAVLTGVGLVSAIPFIAIIYYGARFIFKLPRRHAWVGPLLLGLWLTGLGLTIYTASSAVSGYASYYSVKQSETIKPVNSDTIYIGTSDIDLENTDFMEGVPLTMDTDELKYDRLDLADVKFDIRKSETQEIGFTRKISSRGKTRQDAREHAEGIQFNIHQQDSLFLIDPVFTVSGQEWRNQKVKLVLNLPVGKTVILLKGTEDIIYDIDNIQNIYDGKMPGHAWIMTAEGLSCLDCQDLSEGHDI